MDRAVKLLSPGGVDRMKVEAWPPQEPGPGEIRIRHEAIGVNFLDTYHRTGLYPLPAPFILGVEGAGTVEAVGAEAGELAVGQRVVYAGLPGAYATTRLLPSWRAVPLPGTISANLAAASLLRGLTTHMLLTRVHPVSMGSLVLVHAAAGGLGAMLTRWSKHLGATVIGTAGSPEKAEAAGENGADHVIVGRDADIVAEVGRLTSGRGVDFAIDGIGGTMLAKTLACVRRFGTVASIGQAAGPIPPIRVEDLGPSRSLSLVRPSVMAYTTERETYPAAVRDVLAMSERGVFTGIGREYRLDQAAQAHADLEAGRIFGAAILIP
ncbi:quinone oxidoreductase family protein [Telmatospirillum siberiense]|uniref:Alcohol dehydrogenase n=1 Tax=Telmatospirillum siberiense TaxID=382514 RepID=A0A2N3PUI1_9PROT|nr:quinone oxidoreductase [Telmatospirillum siberiense]PKU24062.1 alcohol dehydrogenase [Telmatospirillum siberiense]